MAIEPASRPARGKMGSPQWLSSPEGVMASSMRTLTQSRSGWPLILLAAVPALLGAALLASRLLSPGPAADASALTPDPAPPAIYARQVCSLSNDDARAAFVQGADGGESFVVGGRTWWLFGDTLFLPESGKQIEQNSIAWSDGTGPDGCPELHYVTRDGVAVPFIPKDGSLTVWPSGGWVRDAHTLDFYTSYVYGSGPYDYAIGELGLARLDTDTMAVTLLSRSLWRAGTPGGQIIGAVPVEIGVDGFLRVVLEVRRDGLSHVLARVAPDEMASPAAYSYWDGAGWTAALDDAQPLWQSADPTDPIAKLATFENGASIAWDAQLGRYVALVNTGFASVGARIAERLEGPWSEPQPWLDCATFAQIRVPTCYSPQIHGAAAGGGLLLTISSIQPYATTAFEAVPGTAVREWRDGDDVAYAPESPGAAWIDQGIAFYASPQPLPGLEPVYRWQSGSSLRYGTAAPDAQFEPVEIAFYAPAAASIAGSALVYRPVVEWTQGDAFVLSTMETGLEQFGYTRGEVRFYAP